MAPTQAEVRTVHLKNCFVNVPQPVVRVLDNAQAVSAIGSSIFKGLQDQVVQNVIIELQYKESLTSTPVSKRSNGISKRSIYVGWTGMASTAKPASLAEKTGRRPKEELGVVEIDTVFARTLGLADGQKVRFFSCSKPFTEATW